MRATDSLHQSARVSVVIPTLNRSDLLLNCVQELLRGKPPHLLEVIVVDQSDTECATLAAHADRRVVYRHVSFKNLPKARNLGIALASGDLVLFLDDDVEAVSGIVDAHAYVHASTGADVVTGPVLARGERMISPAEISPSMHKKMRAGEALISNIDAQFSPLFAPGCNASYRKEILQRVGGFDENFIGSAVSEDEEMSHRVKAHGGRIIYDPAASIVHLHVPMGGCRDEADELKADETIVFNAHYFAHKIGRPDFMRKWFLGILRTRVLNRRALKSLPLSVLGRRAYGLLVAWCRARARTRNLLLTSSGNWVASKTSISKGLG
jgi:GT2 family glycosyltransferase